MQRENGRPIITLTTDFGLQDHYVGTMKGVILGRCRDAQIIDISHEIAPFSIYAGAYAIDQAARYFPAGTVHVVVVDPGVGTARRAILAEVSGQRFIAPDNGVLSMVLARNTHWRMRVIENRDFFLDVPSSTFHGRDIFAPVAASLASRTALPEQLGPEVLDVEGLPDLDPIRLTGEHWRGRVLSIDRFGNAVTNFKADQFANLVPRTFRFIAGEQTITTMRETFGEALPGECFAYVGSSGYIELGINQGRAAQRLQLNPGDSLELLTSD